jgi:uncharacterized membrane protein YqjE
VVPAVPPALGYVASLRALVDALIASGQQRLELLSVEFQEEKLRLIHLGLLLSTAIIAGLLALTFASLTLVYLFWETARLTVLGTLTGAYGIAAVVAVLMLRRFLARQPKVFSASWQELAKDRVCLHPRP